MFVYICQTRCFADRFRVLVALDGVNGLFEEKSGIPDPEIKKAFVSEFNRELNYSCSFLRL